MTTPTPATDEVRQLVVHPAVWPHLTAWLNARGIDVNLMTPAGDDLATYVMSPRDLAAAPAPDGGETAAVRPQERPEGGGESPAASEAPSGPQAGAQPFVTHPHHDHVGVEWIHAGRPEDCDLPDCAEPAGDDVDEQDDLTGWYAQQADGEPLIIPRDAATTLHATLDKLLGAAAPAPGDGPLLARLTDVIAAGRAELRTDAEIARDVWAEMGRGGEGDGLREEITRALRDWIGSQWISSGNGRTYQTDYGRVADAVMAKVQPYLNQLAGLHESFHVVDQHADRAENTIRRVREVVADMHGITGARHWARQLAAALDTSTET